MKGRLTRLKTTDVVVDNPAPLRTTTVEGVFLSPPVVGERFSIVCDPIVEGATGRLVSTSPITSISESGFGTIIKTENSTYLLEIQDGHATRP